ncbi:MAG: KH domain-containing protein [Nanoarchaeota archaeon]
MSIINIQTIRYINLLDDASRVKTRKCFIYNNTIIFAVPQELVSRAIGPGGINVKKIQDKLGKRVRVIKEANSISQAESFVDDIVYPVKFKSLEIRDNIFILNAGSQSKAALIGRNRRREDELRQIVKDTFGIDLKII